MRNRTRVLLGAIILLVGLAILSSLFGWLFWAAGGTLKDLLVMSALMSAALAGTILFSFGLLTLMNRD